MLSDCAIKNYPIAQSPGILVQLSPMDTILLFQKLDSSAGRQRLEGVSAFAREVGWNVHCQSEPLDAEQMRGLVDLWRPVGAILSTNDGHVEYDTDLFSPDSTVLQDCYPPVGMEKFAVVTTDSAAATDIAFRELASAKCAAYGFVPWSARRLWSDNRRMQFRRIAKQYGFVPNEFAPSYGPGSAKALQTQLIAWLRTFPRPFGLLAANDIVGMYVLNACRLARISVPFECIVVGYDGDEAICNGTNPTLSSVGLNFREAGYRAGDLLYRMLRGEVKDKPVVSIPPIGLTRRSSSRVFLQADRHALKATELIQTEACNGLAAKDVLAIFPCSRRMAEMRFRRATGHSVLEEIRAVRIEKAKRLLANPYRGLSVIAEECGYESDTTFRRMFKEETGLTLRQWRRASLMDSGALPVLSRSKLP